MITLSKIAKLAHVSVSTASKAFSGSTEISEETREAVFAIAKEYGVFKKYRKAKYPKHVIAVICPEFEGRDYSTALTALQKHLSAKGCEVCVASTNFSAETACELFAYYNDYATVDGIVFIGHLPSYISYTGDIPLATIAQKHNNVDISVVNSALAGCKAVVAHLKTCNVQTIGLLGEPHTEKSLETMKDLCMEQGFKEENIYTSVSNKRFNEGGYLAAKQLLKKHPLPDAFICSYDNLAIGAMRYLTEQGYSIPKDTLIIGQNNITESAYLTPSLATIDQHLNEACEQAADALHNLLIGNPYPNQITIESEFILRESAKKGM
ncbi:MAG: LacI family DNA-binding transcriptional regulator [Clostridia bacterium]|nr:LacI family DNA-binding transcriptional regulator [Clostridia bacterium]